MRDFDLRLCEKHHADRCRDCEIARLRAEVERLRARSLPSDAEERVRRVLDVPALADVDVDDMARAVLAALAGEEGK